MPVKTLLCNTYCAKGSVHRQLLCTNLEFYGRSHCLSLDQFNLICNRYLLTKKIFKENAMHLKLYNLWLRMTCNFISKHLLQKQINYSWIHYIKFNYKYPQQEQGNWKPQTNSSNIGGKEETINAWITEWFLRKSLWETVIWSVRWSIVYQHDWL